MNTFTSSCSIYFPLPNFEFDSIFQISLLPDKLLFSNYLNSHHDDAYENVWSILTNEISYTIDTNLYSNLKYKPKQLNELDCTNISLYNPAN